MQIQNLSQPPNVPHVVIITGASGGLGKAVTQRCVADGIPVLCIVRTENAAATCYAPKANDIFADSLAVDLADLAATESAVRRWIENKPFRKLAVVCAAGTLGQNGGILDGDLADWAHTIQTNVLGNLAVIRALLPRMLDAGYGRIVTIAGGGAAYAYPLFSGYALSKTAMVRATENIDVELRGKGDFYTVCLAPGAMETNMLQKVRAAGAEVKTTVEIDEPVEFIANFIRTDTCGFSGRFVHVRDDWREWLKSENMPGELWMLRRIEK